MSVQVIVQHRVSDYDAWKPFFEQHGVVRRSHGATGHVIYRSITDPNTVVVVNQFATDEGAQAFLADPSLREIMGQAGVQGAPDVYVCREQETVGY